MNRRRLVSLSLVAGVFAVLGSGTVYGQSAGAPTPQVQTAAASEPLMSQLSTAFGSDHEAATQSAFIQTVLNTRLTKPQYEAHLQQRAIVNQLLDKILRSAKAQPLPYGDDQKQVLVLLHQDIEALGSKWPGRRDAWPLTTDFLREVRDSEKDGPYFALGVFHVYYGGITHGGRDIGAMIADQLKITPTYYLKSDGYETYAQQVNSITDPKAQQEMIRGGVEAYKYIIAINNSDLFKSAVPAPAAGGRRR